MDVIGHVPGHNLMTSLPIAVFITYFHSFAFPHPLVLSLFNSTYKLLPYTALEFRSSFASVFGPASA